jgi:hypothetical protein
MTRSQLSLSDERGDKLRSLRKCRFIVGSLLLLGGSALLLGSQYLRSWQACAVAERRLICEPLELTDVAPLLFLGLILVIPRWSDIGIGPLTVRRELAETQRQQEEIRQVLDLRISVEQALTQPISHENESSEVGAEPDAVKKTLLSEFEGELEQLNTIPTDRQSVAVQRQLVSLQRLSKLARQHPEALAMSEVQALRDQARRLRASVDSAASDVSG